LKADLRRQEPVNAGMKNSSKGRKADLRCRCDMAFDFGQKQTCIQYFSETVFSKFDKQTMENNRRLSYIRYIQFEVLTI